MWKTQQQSKQNHNNTVKGSNLISFIDIKAVITI